MAQGPTVEFGDVFVVRETETALLCRIGAKFHWVAHGRLQPGSTVEHPGDLGVLVLPWDFAVEFWDGAMSDKARRPLCDPAAINLPLVAGPAEYRGKLAAGRSRGCARTAIPSRSDGIARVRARAPPFYERHGCAKNRFLRV
jgi:hypothetical protein